MKCNTAEKWILLEDSGELSSTQSDPLSAHLRDCAACRSFGQVLAEARTASMPQEEPSQAVLNTVKRVARRTPETKRTKIILWKPALAMAASFMILLGLFLSTVRPDRIGLELVIADTELLGTQDQIVNVMYNGLSEDDLAFNFLMTYDEDI